MTLHCPELAEELCIMVKVTVFPTQVARREHCEAHTVGAMTPTVMKHTWDPYGQCSDGHLATGFALPL